jgi:hypothetical protein
MSSHEKALKKMRDNPRDWQIAQLEAIAGKAGLTIRKSGGSHVVFQKNGCPVELSVPAHKPIKPIYITRFLALLAWRNNEDTI